MKRIVVLSGKGGTGKTSIVASLALAAAAEGGGLAAVDCDVDAPNLALLFGMGEGDFEEWKGIKDSEKAAFDSEKCVHCGKCREICEFSAIEWDEGRRMPGIDRFLCEGCGACGIVCPPGAISIEKVENASIGWGRSKYGFPVATGQLKMGESSSGNVVAEVRKMADAVAGKEGAGHMLIDAAAGISCPVIASVTGTDYGLVVTEPTPPALRDAGRAISLLGHFGVPTGMVLNKWDLNPDFSEKVSEFAERNGVPVLSRIPYDKTFTKAVAKLVPAAELSSELKGMFSGIWEKIR